MTGWSPDPYRDGPADPYAGRPPQPYQQYNQPSYQQQYPQPPSWELAAYVPRTGLPGVGIAGIVFGFVAGLLLLLASLLLIIGASFVAGFGDNTSYSGSQFGLAAFGDLIAAGLLVVGGVLVPLRRPAGRLLITAAAALTLVMAGFWGWNIGVADAAFWSILFVGLTVTATALVWQKPVELWLSGVGTAPGAYPGVPGR